MAGATLADVVKNLEGSETWVTADGRQIQIQDMADGHLANTVRFLEKRSDCLKCIAELRYICRMPDPGEVTDGVLDAIEHGLRDLEEEDALEWLQRQPLYRTMVTEMQRRLLRTAAG